jgi:hypothetical protein
MRRVLALVFVIACGGSKPVASVEIPLPQSHAQGGVYAIRLSHPSAVGERAHWVITADEERITTTRRGKDIASDEHTKKRGRLDAIATVMTLDGHGDSEGMSFDVTDLSYFEDGRELVHKKRGRLEITRAKREDDAKVVFDGAPGTEEMRGAAKLLLTLTNVGPSDDEIMGTPAPQRIGSHWKVDGKRAAEALQQEEGGEMMNGASMSGDAWLEGVGAVNGVDCLDVHSVLHVDGLDIASRVPGGVAEVARITATYAAKVPVDTTKSRVSDRQVIEATIKLHAPSPNGEITMETNYASRRDAAYEPLTPEGGASR